MSASLINISFVTLIFGTIAGVFMHDTRLDIAATTSLAPVVQGITAENQSLRGLGLQPDLHVHVERVSLGNLYQEGRLPARPNGLRKSVPPRFVLHGKLSFNDYAEHL